MDCHDIYWVGVEKICGAGCGCAEVMAVCTPVDHCCWYGDTVARCSKRGSGAAVE